MSGERVGYFCHWLLLSLADGAFVISISYQANSGLCFRQELPINALMPETISRVPMQIVFRACVHI